jgi:hypothetical protein
MNGTALKIDNENLAGKAGITSHFSELPYSALDRNLQIYTHRSERDKTFGRKPFPYFFRI